MSGEADGRERIDVDAALAAIEERYPDRAVQSIMPPFDETSTYSAWVTRGFDPWTRETGAGNVYVAVDQYSGEIVYDGTPEEGNVFDQVWDDWSFPLHTGDFGGTTDAGRCGPSLALTPIALGDHRHHDEPDPPPQAGSTPGVETFRSVDPARRRARRRVGPVASGRRPLRRFTVRSRDADPRAAAITAGAAALGLSLPGDVRVADLVFVEGELDDADLDRLGAFLADPLLQTGTWEPPEPATARTSRSRSTPASPTAPPTPSSTPPPSSGCRRRRGDRPAHRAAARHARRRRRRAAAPARRQPDHRALDARAGRARPPPRRRRRRRGADDRRARPRRRAASPGSATERALALDPAELAAVRDHFAGARPRPDRRRAGDARPDVERALRAQDVPRRVDGRRRRAAVAARPAARRQPTPSTPRSCGRRSSATPASSRSSTARRSPSRPRRTTTRRPSSRSAAPTPASAA